MRWFFSNVMMPSKTHRRLWKTIGVQFELDQKRIQQMTKPRRFFVRPFFSVVFCIWHFILENSIISAWDMCVSHNNFVKHKMSWGIFQNIQEKLRFLLAFFFVVICTYFFPLGEWGRKRAIFLCSFDPYSCARWLNAYHSVATTNLCVSSHFCWFECNEDAMSFCCGFME